MGAANPDSNLFEIYPSNGSMVVDADVLLLRSGFPERKRALVRSWWPSPTAASRSRAGTSSTRATWRA